MLRLKKLKRSIGFPKLVVAHDFYTDQSLEDIAEIEVVGLPAPPQGKKEVLFSSNFTITGNVNEKFTFGNLSDFAHKVIFAKQLGEGRGFHGIKEYDGVPLKDLLLKAGVTYDPSMFFSLSAPDGYRSLLSAGEVFLDPAGDRMIVADKVGGKPLEKEGRFQLIIPDDGFADRWVKALKEIEVVRLSQ